MTPHVYGIDPSLTSTGIAHITPDGSTSTWRVKSKGVKGATWQARHARIADLSRRVTERVSDYGAGRPLVVIEAPSYGSVSTSVHDRAGLWWAVYDRLHEQGARIVPVSPAQRMMYATGTGRADKDAVLAAVIRRYLHVEVTGNDEADALVFAALGRRLVGEPVEASLPKTHLRALAKIPPVPGVVLTREHV